MPEKTSNINLYYLVQEQEENILALKTMKDFLEYNGISENIGSPREVLRRAFESYLIENGEEWIDMMFARNSLSHLYDEETSRKIYKEIKEKNI